MTDCIFCKIVKGEIPSHNVYENEKVLAFLDIHPVSKGHVLVIPKSHSQDILDMEEADAQATIIAAKRMTDAIMKRLGASGVNLLNANRKSAGQSVFHFHMHVIPRYDNDKLRLFPVEQYPETDFRATAEMIRGGL